MSDSLLTALVAIGAFVGIILIYTAFSFIFAIPVMYLWNWLMPDIFGLQELSYIKSWGLLMLSALLIKSPTNIKKSNE